MPWEKSFNEQEVLDNATQVFWQKGYESTSIADLLDRTGLNRGSLYNAYGGKQALFIKTLLNYDQTRLEMLAALEALDEPVKAITKFFDDVVSSTLADTEHKGCFLFNTALQIHAHDRQVNEIVTNGINQIEAFFRRSIEVGQARGDIRKELDPAETAKTLIALTVAIRVLGRGVFNKSALQTIANQAKKIIL
ncbi:TetR/AcrR family transcriptional regulator [Arenicella xantha]|uniref:TetR family transcriptional regulator n=1 Tax=Arenicella xantha TaxID=644221 RepID=A0A395JKZ0_9GAMM|nr:TetR/AcrR family transcriptional regulator [Arenicella xantha]RBP51095.1 TetR family transcriptional regulator [Arenicella xantha]